MMLLNISFGIVRMYLTFGNGLLQGGTDEDFKLQSLNETDILWY